MKQYLRLMAREPAQAGREAAFIEAAFTRLGLAVVAEPHPKGGFRVSFDTTLDSREVLNAIESNGLMLVL